jgi:hypothetical protein
MTASTSILDSLQLGSLPAPEQEEILLALGDIVFRGTLLRLIKSMDETVRTEFAVLLADNAPPGAIEAFLKERVSGAEAAAEETLSDLASDLSAVGV